LVNFWIIQWVDVNWIELARRIVQWRKAE